MPGKKSSDNLIRIAHLLSQRGVASRRQSEKMVEEGRVTVNGEQIIHPGTKVDPDTVTVAVDGKIIPPERRDIYLAVYKPAGMLSSFTKDRETGSTLGSILPHQRRLFVSGRLDHESEGLLLITSDGEWANRVMHPRYEKEKEYLVKFRGVPSDRAAKKLEGVTFEEEGRQFGASRVEVSGPWVKIVLGEGRKRQIRRLASEVNLHVTKLVRVRIGDVRLGSLKPGEHRALSKQEVATFWK